MHRQHSPAHGISHRARGEPRGNRTGRDPVCTAISLHGGDGHHALAETPVQRALDELLHGWSVYELDLGTFAQTARAHGRATLRLDGRLLELDLEPVDLRADGLREARIGTGGQFTERQREFRDYWNANRSAVGRDLAHWDFGDGITGGGETVNHFYTQSGSFVVTLTVTDDDGETDTRQDLVDNCLVFEGRDGFCTSC